MTFHLRGVNNVYLRQVTLIKLIKYFCLSYSIEYVKSSQGNDVHIWSYGLKQTLKMGQLFALFNPSSCANKIFGKLFYICAYCTVYSQFLSAPAEVDSAICQG